MGLFQGLFTAPSWQTFTFLACGWALAGERHTITPYLWVTGAATVKHFSRFYVFLGSALYQARWQGVPCPPAHPKGERESGQRGPFQWYPYLAIDYFSFRLYPLAFPS